MGFTIFTSSGTFTPSDYGLKAGDCIHIICVGGGGSGSGGTNSAIGNAGGSSSFGNIVTSAGGSGGIYNGIPTAQVGSSQPSFPGIGKLPNGTGVYNCYYGGCGGHGWHPQLLSPPIAGSAISFVSTHITSQSSSSISRYPIVGTSGFVDIGGNRGPLQYTNSVIGQSSAQTGLFGGYGGTYNDIGSCYYLGGAGGVGYGAGGGGCGTGGNPGGGGNGGVITHKDYVLTSTSGIAITVGAGGSSPNNYNGGGARGCVAIFW